MSRAMLFKLSRFAMAGATGAAVALGILYALTDLAHIWYFTSAAVAFVISQAVSFVLQKLWTFEDRSKGYVKRQAARYLAIGLVNLGANALLMYALVDIWAVHYLLAQMAASILIAAYSFALYGRIFKSSLSPDIAEDGESL